MTQTLETVSSWLESELVTWALPWVQAAITVVLGWVLARVIAGLVARLAAERTSPQGVLVARRLAFWGVLGLTVANALGQVGFDFTVLLGAAGILTVAIGFASQTSASNLISGLFLLTERPFVLGDVIKASGYTGEVVSIDLLSVKLRTFDNLLVRIPNESLLKADLQNLTHFPIRRLDLPLTVPHGTDIEAVRELLVATADAHPLALDEPRPVVMFVAFGQHGYELQYSVWAARETWFELKNTLPKRARDALEGAGVRLAVPRVEVSGVTSRPELP